MEKKKHFKLEYQPETRLILFGLVNPEPILRLSFLINKAAGIKLSEDKTIEFEHPKTGEKLFYQVYSCFDEENHLGYRLLENRSNNFAFLDECKNFDYLLVVSGDTKTKQITGLTKLLRALEGVRMVHFFPVEQLKGVKKLWM